MRPLLQHFYADLFSSPASLYSIDPGMWPDLWKHLNDSLQFISVPPGTGIPKDGLLVSVRHQPVSTKTDLANIRLSERRLWLRIRNPNSSKRTLSKSSVRCLQLFRTWIMHLCPLRSMYPKPIWPGFSAVDACAMGSTFQIGGFYCVG